MAPAGGDDGRRIGVLSLSATQGARPKAPSNPRRGAFQTSRRSRFEPPNLQEGDEMGGIGTLVLDVKI